LGDEASGLARASPYAHVALVVLRDARSGRLAASLLRAAASWRRVEGEASEDELDLLLRYIIEVVEAREHAAILDALRQIGSQSKEKTMAT